MHSLTHSASVLAVNSAFVFEAGSLSVAPAGLELVLTGELPASVSDVLRLKLCVHFYPRRLIVAVSVPGRVSASQGRGCGLLCSPHPTHFLSSSAPHIAKRSPASLLLALRTLYLGQSERLTEPILSCVCMPHGMMVPSSLFIA